MRKIAAVLAALLLASPAFALELSLEENRAEHGSVGFVDMQRLFASSPDAQRAKDSFEEVVRQAEERVNRRRAELLKLHRDLAATRAARAALAASANAAPKTPAPAPSVSTAAAPALSTAAAPSEPAKAPPLVRKETALPGMSPTETAPTAPPAAVASSSASAATAVSTAAVAVSSAAAPSSVAASSAPASVAVSSTAAPTQSLAQRLLNLDGRIIAMQAKIQTEEAALTHEREDADKGLVDVENRKTDKVLADLYRAIAAVARQQGVSIVVDKTVILYGHPAVDLTDRVLEYLKEHPQP